MFRIVSDDEWNKNHPSSRRHGSSRSRSSGRSPSRDPMEVIAHLEREEKALKDLRERFIEEHRNKDRKKMSLSPMTIFWFMVSFSPAIGLLMGYIYIQAAASLMNMAKTLPIP